MKLATSTLDFGAYTQNQLDAVRYIREGGFRYVDYNFGLDQRLRKGVFASGWEAYCQNLRHETEALGMKFVQAHAPTGWPISKGNEQLIADTMRAIEACHILGIPNLVVHSGWEKGLSVEETFERNRKFFNQLLQVAERYNVCILVENHEKMVYDDIYWIDNAPDLLKLIEYVDHPLFHAIWDTGHGLLRGMPQHEALKILGKHVRAVHIQDNRGSGDTHMIPFTGILNFDSLMHGLQEIDYQGYFTFETAMFLPADRKQEFDGDTRLRQAPLSLKIEAEKLLYQIGKHVLDAYGVYEE